MQMKNIYLGFSVLGFVVPYIFFGKFLFENGIDIGLFFTSLFSNDISSFFGVDVIISAIVLIIYILIDAKRYEVKRYSYALIGTLLVGVSFALPFYLYLKESQKKN